MKRMLETKRTVAAIAALLGSILPAQAGLLNIATDPLGTATTSNKPNVMFILDDSGSMGRDSMPDYLDDSHNPGASNPTTAACADAADDDSGSIGGSPDACVFGDPPYNSPDLNGIYYNPAIFYRPAANADGTDMDSQNSLNTAAFTKVMVNPYTSISTIDLSASYQDRVFCIAQGDAATSGNCRQNSAYQYPDPTFKYGRDGGGGVKYVAGAPYYYRMQSAQYCNATTPTNCASGSSIDITTHTQLSPEFCSDAELTDCVAGGNVNPSVHIFSGVRWCADAGTLADCRRKKGDLVNLSGTLIKRYIYAKHLGVTQSITCPVGSYCSAAANEGNIKVNSVNAAGGTILDVTINGVQVVTGAITVPAGATPSQVAVLIRNSINTKASSPEYTAVDSGSNVVITKTVTGSTGNGWVVAVNSSQIGTQSSIGRITISSTSAPNSPQTITDITVNGVNLLCPVASDISFGNGVTVKAINGRIEAQNGTSSASKRTSLRNAIEARIDACAISGFSATQSGSDVNIVAPVSQGSAPNGLPVAKVGSNLGNVSTGNMGSVQLGVQVAAVDTTVSNMSGGRDALSGTQTIRKGVGAFTRTDIVPSNNSYPRAGGRLDCAGATCTYEEEMTNFSNWYAYYRTRMQMMKAAVGRAFVSVGSSYRVGFITICPVSGNNCQINSLNASVVAGKYLKIDDFTGTHRLDWYAKLYATQPSNYTPLREALSRVGLIFAGQFNTPLTGGLTAAADDPVTASCQPNFAILSTDGYWNGGTGKQLDGKTDVGNQDNTNAGPYSLQSQGVYDGGLAGSTNTLADVALFYYKNDLRTSGAVATNNVPTTSKDTASHQHMVTFAVGLGLDGQLTYRPDYETAGSGDFFDIKQGTKKWTVPAADSPTALDDLWHGAVNGRGVFFSAKNPEELSNGLSETLNQLQARVGAGAAAATSNLQPVAGDNFAFTAQYQTAAWIGDVKARTIDLSSGIVGQVQLWSAASLLDGQVFNTRTHFTADDTDTTGNGLKHFCWPGEGGTTCSDGSGLSATEQAYFHPSLLPQWPTLTTLQKDAATQSTGPTWAGANAGQNLVNWLRGSGLYNNTGQSLPTDLFRERLSRLGDVVNAQPAYVKKSPFSYNDTGYAGFKKCTEGTGTACASAQFPAPSVSRRGTVYAASNDGMLHAFETDVNNNPYYQTAGIPTAATSDDAFTGNNTGNGVERWTYIPRVILPGMYRLADTGSPFPHAYHVDGSPTVGDICLSPCTSQDNWRTILVAGLNSGGRGYYALDVTNPLAPKGLWEFTNSTFCALTDSAGVPTATSPAGGDYKSDCHVGLSYGNPIIAKRKSDGKWVVFVTSGYNNNINGGDGKGYLYMLDAATGVILGRFSTGVGTAASPSGLARINGWATSAMLDNTVLGIYGGDLEGNLWRFDMDSSSGSYLQVTKIAALVNSLGLAQPITVRPELGELESSGLKKRIVMVGTGKFLEATDKTGPFITQTIYALRDDLTGGAGPVVSNVRNTTLVKPRQFTAGTDPDTRTVNPTDPAPNWSTEYGWLIDLPDSGEHVNIDPQLQLGTLVIASNVPTSDTCTAGGYSYVNFIDYATGSYVPGAPGNMASTKIASSVAVGINVVMLPGGKVVAIVTTADNQQLTKDTPVGAGGFGGRRVSWRELIRDQ
jgi:type IV pilus assembly protein PilY1